MKEQLSTLFVGVDTHKETHTLVGTNLVSEPLCELTFPNTLEGFQRALTQIKAAAKEYGLTPLVGLEDSGGNGLAFASFLTQTEIRVRTVNPLFVKRERRYETHPEKSDSRDALGVAKVLVQRTDRLPTFRITQNREFAKNLGVLVKDREDVGKEQTKLKNRLHWAFQRLWGLEYKRVYQKSIFGKRALKFWEKYPGARDFKRTTRPLKPKPEWIRRAKESELPEVSGLDRQHVRRLIKRLQILEEQQREIEEQLTALIQGSVPYLLSLPGCGVVNAASLLVYTKDIDRFPGERQLAQFAGIAPRKYESGRKRRDRISIRGHYALRRTFKSIALAQLGKYGNQQAKAYYRKKLSEGKPKKQALRCLMRQNVKIIYQMMKEQRPYY